MTYKMISPKMCLLVPVNKNEQLNKRRMVKNCNSMSLKKMLQRLQIEINKA